MDILGYSLICCLWMDWLCFRGGKYSTKSGLVAGFWGIEFTLVEVWLNRFDTLFETFYHLVRIMLIIEKIAFFAKTLSFWSMKLLNMFLLLVFITIFALTLQDVINTRAFSLLSKCSNWWTSFTRLKIITWNNRLLIFLLTLIYFVIWDYSLF